MVLLYVGAVLAVNGIWLIGQATAATRVSRAVAAEGQELAGEQVVAVTSRAQRSPLFIQNREVAVLNIFTGFVGVVAAITLVVQGNKIGDLSSIRAAGLILLFAFTYIWVSFNQFLNAGGRAFGWYCLFVAITAIPAGVYTLQAANGNTALIWLGIDWFAWAVLWGMFWALLALELPIARIAGSVAILEGVGTSWALAIAILEGKLAFLSAGSSCWRSSASAVR
ncbi:MAG TPA: AmiS/UreI family transporter [Streptosporangiaceae bacterium]|nr:AmiS/UreI family transporter [Streptosporangiaceae bacterium]